MGRKRRAGEREVSNRTARLLSGRADELGCERTSLSINGDHLGLMIIECRALVLYERILMALPSLNFHLVNVR